MHRPDCKNASIFSTIFQTLMTGGEDSEVYRQYPDTRKALIERLAERGYDALVLMQIRAAIMAEKSDLFDVLA